MSCGDDDFDSFLAGVNLDELEADITTTTTTTTAATAATTPAVQQPPVPPQQTFPQSRYLKPSQLRQAAVAKQQQSLPQHARKSQPSGIQQRRQAQELFKPFPPYLDDLNDPLPQCNPEAIKTWLYPTVCEKRQYQYDIVRSALFENTLVCLPTGLGKTFIAAAVILNFYRWFPNGKIIFIAHTKPLVDQQISAVHDFTGIPKDDQCELTGTTKPSERKVLWGEKRVFYATPQIISNDISSGNNNNNKKISFSHFYLVDFWCLLLLFFKGHVLLVQYV